MFYQYASIIIQIFFVCSAAFHTTFLDVKNAVLEITDFCPKLQILSILITDFSS